MGTIKYPVIIKYADEELGIYRNEEKFFEESGCEEYDFFSDQEFICDAEGKALTFDQQSMALSFKNEFINEEKLIQAFHQHLAMYQMTDAAETFLAESQNKDTAELIELGLSIPKRYM